MALIGVALVRMLISDSRFVASQDGMMSARQGSRAAMNVMSAELRGVAQGGLVSASRDSIVVVVPFAFGMTCNTVSNTVIASLMPPDSLSYATSTADTMAWRDPNSGTYKLVPLTGIAPSTQTSACTADSIRVLSGGKLLGISGIPSADRPPTARLFYLAHTIRYKFAASTLLPGRRALWRQAGSGAWDELVAPFDTAAKFQFLVGPSLTLQASPPADLTTVRGLELQLISESVSKAPGVPDYQRFRLVTRVPFLNVVQ